MKEMKCQHHKINKINDKNQFIYSKVDNDKRMVLLNMVKQNGKSLKEASNLLKINYSTAKTILRVYRIENRILKKSSSENNKKNKGCKCVSTDTRHEVHSTFDSPEKDSEVKSNHTVKENTNYNMNSNVKVMHNKQPDLGNFANFSLNRVGGNNPIGVVQRNSPMIPYEHNKQENKFNLPKFMPNKSPPLFNQSNLNNNFLNDFVQKVQFNMLSIQNCYKKIDQNTAMINNVYYLFDRMRMNKMFS